MSAGTGKTMRMSRIFDANGNAVIFAPVHNSTSVDPFKGQLDVPAVVTEAGLAGATAMNLTKGSIRDCAPTWIGGIGALHYTFSYTPLGPDPIRQVEVGTVEESLRLGADGVCLFVGLATANDYEVISAIGRIADECDRHGLVFVCEAEFPGFYDSMEKSLEHHGLRYPQVHGPAVRRARCRHRNQQLARGRRRVRGDCRLREDPGPHERGASGRRA